MLSKVALKYPICDTDIWVDIMLADLGEKLFDKYKNIIVADVVEYEIKCFGANPEYKFIAENFDRYKESTKICVVRHIDIPKEDRMLLEKQLQECSFQFKSGLSDNPHERHKGEIVSALYAEYLELPFLKSNDGTFKDGGQGRRLFPDLVVKNRWDMICDLVSDIGKHQEVYQKIKDGRDMMNESKRIYENAPLDETAVGELLSKLRM